MKRKASKTAAAPEPPTARREGRRTARTADAPLTQQYKVVELSTVDEVSLESAVNEWVGRGWRLEGIHFAMRESSKRPAMAFVLFTRMTTASAAETAGASGPPSALRSVPEPQAAPSEPWRRLRQLAGVDSGDDGSGDSS